MDYKPEKTILTVAIALMLILSFLNTAHTNALGDVALRSTQERDIREDVFGESNVTVSAYQNVTLYPLNNSIDLGSPSQVSPTYITADIVNGFEPLQRFNSGHNFTFDHDGNALNYSLTEADDGLRLSFSAKDTSKPSISVYRLSFADSVNISNGNFVSLAISTESSYNSAEGYVGIALLLRDQQDVHYYVSMHISDLYTTDQLQLAPHFLGYTYDPIGFKQYPLYRVRYRSTFGPWFIQLSLADAFKSLNLSSVWLDGLLVGAELYSTYLPYNTTQADVRFHYILVHQETFSINQEAVNSTNLTLPGTRFLNISGIFCKSLNATLSGSLRPSYDKEEEHENQTVRVREVFYNFSEGLSFNVSGILPHEIRFEGRVNITVWSKSVRECILTLNNLTIVNLTNSLLMIDRGLVYRFPLNTSTLRVLLVLYKYNAWIFDRASATLTTVTKKGIVDESFVPSESKSVVAVNASETGVRDTNIAFRAGNFSSGEISVNGVVKPIDSLLVLNNEIFLATSLKIQDNVSLYTIKCTFYSDPLYFTSTMQPFNLLMGNSLFAIYTPFNIESQLGVQIPLTLRISTSKTYILKINYDSTMFEIDNDEFMVSKPAGYQYFMLKPLSEGVSEVGISFTDPSVKNSTFSILFLVDVTRSLVYEIMPYAFLIITVLSLMYVVPSKDLIVQLLHRLRRKNTVP